MAPGLEARVPKSFWTGVLYRVKKMCRKWSGPMLTLSRIQGSRFGFNLRPFRVGFKLEGAGPNANTQLLNTVLSPAQWLTFGGGLFRAGDCWR